MWPDLSEAAIVQRLRLAEIPALPDNASGGPALRSLCERDLPRQLDLRLVVALAVRGARPAVARRRSPWPWIGATDRNEHQGDPGERRDAHRGPPAATPTRRAVVHRRVARGRRVKRLRDAVRSGRLVRLQGRVRDAARPGEQREVEERRRVAHGLPPQLGRDQAPKLGPLVGERLGDPRAERVHGQRIDGVGSQRRPIDVIPARLLGRRVRRLALECPVRRVAVAVRAAGDPEVDQLRLTGICHDHIVRRRIAVHQPQRTAVVVAQFVRMV